MISESVTVQAPCKTCGLAYDTPYCPKCGEKRISAHDYSISHFAEHAFEVFTHFDLKFFSSLKSIVIHPGLLTLDYLEGRRKPHVGPVQLFVIVNIAFFLFSTLFSFRIFNQSLDKQIETPTRITGNFLPKTKAARVQEEIAHRGVEYKDFEKEFNAESTAHAKSLVFVTIPLFALGVMLCCGPRRRYLFEHLIFATHTIAFWLLLVMALVPVAILFFLAAAVFGQKLNPSDSVLTLVIFVTFAAYLFVACRRVYRGGIPINLLRAAVLSYSMVPILQLYRVFLFYVVINTMH